MHLHMCIYIYICMYVYTNLHQISSFHHHGSPTGLFAFARTTSSSTTWAPLRCTECVMAMDLLDTWCPSAWCRPCRFISAKVTGAVWSWRCLMLFDVPKWGDRDSPFPIISFSHFVFHIFSRLLEPKWLNLEVSTLARTGRRPWRKPFKRRKRIWRSSVTWHGAVHLIRDVPTVFETELRRLGYLHVYIYITIYITIYIYVTIYVIIYITIYV